MVEEKEMKEETYFVIEVKDGVYLKKDKTGNYRLTEDLKQAVRFEYPKNGYINHTPKQIAKEWFGTLKTLIISWEVQ